MASAIFLSCLRFHCRVGFAGVSQASRRFAAMRSAMDCARFSGMPSSRVVTRRWGARRTDARRSALTPTPRVLEPAGKCGREFAIALHTGERGHRDPESTWIGRLPERGWRSPTNPPKRSGLCTTLCHLLEHQSERKKKVQALHLDAAFARGRVPATASRWKSLVTVYGEN